MPSESQRIFGAADEEVAVNEHTKESFGCFEILWGSRKSPQKNKKSLEKSEGPDECLKNRSRIPKESFR